MYLIRQKIGKHRDHALAAKRHQGHDLVVVPGINVQPVGALCGKLRNGADISGRFFYRHDALVLRKLPVYRKRDVATGPGGNVVQDHRLAYGVGKRQKAFGKPPGTGFVVVGRNGKQSVRSHVAGVAGKRNAVRCVVGAGAGNDRYPSCRLFHRIADQLAVLLVRKGCRFSRGAGNDQCVDSQ